MARDEALRQDDLVTDGSEASRRLGWIERRRLRYKRHQTVTLGEVRGELKTGDILLFHKTSRAGILDTLELDFLAPLFFPENEFRHSGIVVRRNDALSVIECTEEFHSGHLYATYPAGGKGIREVPLEPLLGDYKKDNGDPHFGVRLISREIPTDLVMSTVKQIGPVSYLKASRSAALFLSSYLIPPGLHNRLIAFFAREMMCSEFVHVVLARCGALRDYPSKIFAPYIIENSELFERHDLAGYSPIVRFVV